MKSEQLVHFVSAIALLLGFGSCSAPNQISSGQPMTSEGAPATAGYAQPPPGRPGLGTKWGENRKSLATETQFVRATPNQPFAIARIFYNDRSGIEAMANASLDRSRWVTSPPLSTRLLSIAIRDQSHRFLPGLVVGDRWFVVGEEGRRYSIVVRNFSDWRLETVISVDGLDVVDGRPASLRKRGYVIDPHKILVVDGFRQSLDTVAAFRFGPVRESYSQEKYHTTRNVGVIGLAAFNEKGSTLDEREIDQRLKAKPFPVFATPPNE